MLAFLLRVWSWLVSPAVPPQVLTALPDDVVTLLAAFLDARSLCAVVLVSRDWLPSVADAWRRRMQMRLPPDITRNYKLMRFLTNRSSRRKQEQAATENHIHRPLRPLVDQFVVADTRQAEQLLAGADTWEIIAQFTVLQRLVLDQVWDRHVDLAVLSRSAPHLQELTIKHARRVTNRLVGMHSLRMLHLEATNIESFEIAVGLPSLQSLSLLVSSSRRELPTLHGVRFLADVAPLTQLVVRGKLDEDPRHVLQVHCATLREVIKRNEAKPLFASPSGVYVDWPWRDLVHLRTLWLGQYQHTDLEPLSLLVALEDLQLVIHRDVQDCVPLRRLTRLRALDIAEGWMCDLVGYLPRLEKLVWQVNRRCCFYIPCTTLWRRSLVADTTPIRGDRTTSRLRTVVFRGYIGVRYSDPWVREMLEFAEQVEVCNRLHLLDTLDWIAELRHLKRLALAGMYIPWVETPWERPSQLACAESLEELFYEPRGLEAPGPPIVWGHGEPGPMPLWFADRFPNLRVLACPYEESMAVLGEICPRLTHVYIPFSGRCDFERTNRESLSRLRVVSLAMEYDCLWLRQERGPGRALPSLQRIFHPTTDCLSSPSVCERHRTVGRDRSFGRGVFVMDKMLCPPWGHDWGFITLQYEDEQFHRLVPE